VGGWGEKDPGSLYALSRKADDDAGVASAR